MCPTPKESNRCGRFERGEALTRHSVVSADAWERGPHDVILFATDYQPSLGHPAGVRFLGWAPSGSTGRGGATAELRGVGLTHRETLSMALSAEQCSDLALPHS